MHAVSAWADCHLSLLLKQWHELAEVSIMASPTPVVLSPEVEISGVDWASHRAAEELREWEWGLDELDEAFSDALLHESIYN
jgi:hypothetical protein